MKSNKGLWFLLISIIVISLLVEWRPWQHESSVAIVNQITPKTEEVVSTPSKIPETIV
jgi:hypothetical protein